MRRFVVLFGLALLAAPGPAMASGGVKAERIPVEKTESSVLFKRLRAAIKATGLRGKRVNVLERAKGKSWRGAQWLNRNILEKTSGLKAIPLTEDVQEKVGIFRPRMENVTHRLSEASIDKLLDEQKALHGTKLNAQLERTTRLEGQLLERMDRDFSAGRQAWNDKVRAAPPEKLAQRAVTLIQDLDGFMSDRDIRQVPTGESHSSGSYSNSHYGLLSGHSESGSFSSSSISNALVLGASHYRIDLVELQHAQSLLKLEGRQKHTPQARLLVERVLQATDLVRELERKDAENGTHHAAPFQRWVRESTIEIVRPRKAEVESGELTLHVLKMDRGDKVDSSTLRLGRLKQDLVAEKGKFDFVTSRFVDTLKTELASSERSMINKLPDLD